MHSMTQHPPIVVGDVDAHAEAHHLAVLDQRGTLLGSASFSANTRGYADALNWLEHHGRVDAVAVESTGSYAAGLVRYLRARLVRSSRSTSRIRTRAGEWARAIGWMRRWRRGSCWRALRRGAQADHRDRRGDPPAARRAGERPQGKNGGDTAVITAPEPLRDRLATRKSLRGKAGICARFRISPADMADPSVAAKLALRTFAQRIEALDHEIAALDRELEQLVKRAAPRTIQLLGISTGHAGQLLTTAGENIERLTSESSFAALCGASPIPASSGKTSRHRLNPGGDRDANRALHLIAVVRLRYCQRTRAYAERRTREGKSKREIIRCLKRYIAREVYTASRRPRQPPQQRAHRTPRDAVAIHCGSPGIGITRHRT
jgi:transposase